MAEEGLWLYILSPGLTERRRIRHHLSTQASSLPKELERCYHAPSLPLTRT